MNIAANTCNRIQLTFEELVQQILLPELATPKLDVVIEYSEDGEAVMTVNSDAMTTNPLDGADELSLAVLRGATSEITYSEGSLKLSVK